MTETYNRKNRELAWFVNWSWEPYLMTGTKTDSHTSERNLLRRHAPVHRGARAGADRPHASARRRRAAFREPHRTVRGPSFTPRGSFRRGARAGDSPALWRAQARFPHRFLRGAGEQVRPRPRPAARSCDGLVELAAR